MTVRKRILVEVLALLGICFLTMYFSTMVVNAAESTELPPMGNNSEDISSSENDTMEYSQDTEHGTNGDCDGDAGDNFPAYYDESLSIAELYSNVDPTTTKYTAVEYGSTTEQPMLAAYTDDPNWGDHRQFARMYPAFANLTPGDAVAKIWLKPDMEYFLVEYLVNTAADEGENIEGLHIYIDIPSHIYAETSDFVYAYLESKNDAGGSRVCFIELYSDSEIWLTLPLDYAICNLENVSGSTNDALPLWVQDMEIGAKIDDAGHLRNLIEIEWPEGCQLSGGTNNGYFVNLDILTHAENPFVVTQELTEEEFWAAIGDDPNASQETGTNDPTLDEGHTASELEEETLAAGESAEVAKTSAMTPFEKVLLAILVMILAMAGLIALFSPRRPE